MSRITAEGELQFATAAAAKKAANILTKAGSQLGTLEGKTLQFADDCSAAERTWGQWVQAAQLAAGDAVGGVVRVDSPEMAMPQDLVPGGWLRRVVEELPAPAVCRLGSVRFRHSGGLVAVAVHPERRWVATGSKGARHFVHDGYEYDSKGSRWGHADVCVWNLDDGRLVAEFLGRSETVLSLAFSGNRLLAGVRGSKSFPRAASRKQVVSAFVFDLETQQSSKWAGDAERGGVCWCGPDRFAAGGNRVVTVCSVEGEALYELYGHEKDIVDIVWCGTTERLFSLDHAGVVVAWDAVAGRELGRVTLAERSRSGLACWEVEGRCVIAATGYSPILIDPTDLSVIEGMKLPHSIKDARPLGEDEVRVIGERWSVGEEMFEGLGPLGVAAIDGVGELLAQASSHCRKLVIRGVRDGSWKDEEPLREIKKVCMTGTHAGLFEWQGEHWLHELPSGKPLRRMPYRFGHNGTVLPSPCGTRLVRTCKDQCELVDLASGEARILAEESVVPFAFASGDRLVAVVGKRLCVLSLVDGSRRELRFEGDYRPRDECWGRMLDDRRFLLFYRGVRVWDLVDDVALLEVEGGSAAFVDDENLVVCAKQGRESQVHRFDRNSLALTSQEPWAGRRLDGLLSPSLGLDCSDGVLSVKDLSSGATLLRLRGHLSGCVPGFALSSDNQWLATLGGEGTVLVYPREVVVALANEARASE